MFKLQKKAQALVTRINEQEGLQLNAGNLLGYPCPAFLVFDKANRKLSYCNTVDWEYRIFDFEWLLSWEMTWREVESMELQGGSRVVNATGVSVPTFDRVTRYKDFALELQGHIHMRHRANTLTVHAGRNQAGVAKIAAQAQIALHRAQYDLQGRLVKGIYTHDYRAAHLLQAPPLPEACSGPTRPST